MRPEGGYGPRHQSLRNDSSIEFPRRTCCHFVFFRAVSASPLPSPPPWPGPPSPGLEDCGLATRERLEAWLPSSLQRGHEMGAARAAPKLRLASLLGHFPTASVFRKEKLSLSALRLRRKEFPLPFCSAERGRISRDLSKLGDFFYFHFAPASLSAHKCKHSSVIPNPHALNWICLLVTLSSTTLDKQKPAGVGWEGQTSSGSEVLHCIDFKFCFLCCFGFFLSWKIWC